jgi:hypothetical protein
MLTQLETVKSRLSILPTDTQHDALLTKVIEAVSARFDLECGRTLARTVDATFEFEGDEIEIAVPCYPIESVSGFQTRQNDVQPWLDVAAQWIVRRRCVVSLLVQLATGEMQARVKYTGGYVLPGATVGAGQTKLPAVLELAATDQVAFWFQQRDKLGMMKYWPSGGDLVVLESVDLLPQVRGVLGRFTRWVI